MLEKTLVAKGKDILQRNLFYVLTKGRLILIYQNIGGGFLQVTYKSINNLLPYFHAFKNNFVYLDVWRMDKRVWVVYLIMFLGFRLKLESERFFLQKLILKYLNFCYLLILCLEQISRITLYFYNIFHTHETVNKIKLLKSNIQNTSRNRG